MTNNQKPQSTDANQTQSIWQCLAFHDQLTLKERDASPFIPTVRNKEFTPCWARCPNKVSST